MPIHAGGEMHRVDGGAAADHHLVEACQLPSESPARTCSARIIMRFSIQNSPLSKSRADATPPVDLDEETQPPQVDAQDGQAVRGAQVAGAQHGPIPADRDQQIELAVLDALPQSGIIQRALNRSQPTFGEIRTGSQQPRRRPPAFVGGQRWQCAGGWNNSRAWGLLYL